jgi:hypothetical protein
MGDLMAPSYAVDFRGFPACPCQAIWLPAYEHELQRRGLLRGPLHLYQLIGGAAASGGTHVDGGATDTEFIGDKAVWVARQMGADATWHRPKGWDGPDSMEHVHSVLRGCPHNTPARYQITAVDLGYNGLGHLGEAARDDGPRPLSERTWQQGIQWAKEQENPDMALLADLDAAAKKHGASRLKAARVLLRAVAAARGPVAKTRIATALAAIRGMLG